MHHWPLYPTQYVICEKIEGRADMRISQHSSLEKSLDRYTQHSTVYIHKLFIVFIVIFIVLQRDTFIKSDVQLRRSDQSLEQLGVNGFVQ